MGRQKGTKNKKKKESVKEPELDEKIEADIEAMEEEKND